MSIRILFTFALLTATILFGCSQSIKPGDKEASIGDLGKKPAVFEPVNASAPSHRDALDNYRTYLADNENTLYHGEVLRRMAALELEESETVHGQVTEQKTDAGEWALKSSIEHYTAYLKLYPDKKDNDHVLYQLAKAYSFVGETEKSLSTFDEIIRRYPQTEYIDEIQFRRGEILFVFNDYYSAEQAYLVVVSRATATQYLERSQYKLAWSQFKQANYIASLENCIALLDRKQAQGKLDDTSVSTDLVRTESVFINDVLRIVSLSLSYTGGTKTIQQILADKPTKQYEPLIYRQLGELYVKTERTVDAANVFLDYAKQHPGTLMAAEFHMLAIKSYAAGNMAELQLAAAANFVKNFGVGTAFWENHDAVSKQVVKAELKKSIRDLANYHHAVALKTGKSKDYISTSIWYEEYIRSFPQDPDTPRMNFLLAESQHDAGQYHKALNEYVKTAYNYSPHSKSSESGYAAILTYKLLIDKASKRGSSQAVAKLEAEALKNSIRFSFQFRDSKHAPAVIAKTAEKLYENKNYTYAKEFSRKNAHLQNMRDKSHFKTVWLVYAHSLFELQEYAPAEQAYSATLKLIPKKDALYKGVSEKLAASIYMQGRQQRDQKHYELASYHFLRIGHQVPTSSILATAQYDAAAMQIQLKNWDKATSVLEDFRKKFPNNKKYSQGVTEKLVLAYTQSGQLGRSADELYKLSLATVNIDERRDLTWQAAETYQKAGVDKKANKIYIAYITKYPKPFAQNIEAHQRVIDYYREKRSTSNLNKWMVATVKAEKRGKNNRTDRTRFIAASAALELADPLLAKFKQARLTIPLKKSLKAKKKLMEKSLKSYSDLMEYKISEITTASTYHVADIYGHFAVALMKSQRPKNLNEEELEQYDILLEEQAYPFEEKAIEVHSANAMRTSSGTYDDWVKKSIKALSVLQPIRYAKNERLETYVASTY